MHTSYLNFVFTSLNIVYWLTPLRAKLKTESNRLLERLAAEQGTSRRLEERARAAEAARAAAASELHTVGGSNTHLEQLCGELKTKISACEAALATAQDITNVFHCHALPHELVEFDR